MLKSYLFLMILLAIVFDALADGLRDRYHYDTLTGKSWMIRVSGLCEALQVVFLMIAGWMFVELVYSGKYISIWEFILYGPMLYSFSRMLWFDIIYNVVRGLGISYIGTTKWYDRFLTQMLHKLKMPVFYYRWAMFIGWMAFSGWLILNRPI